MCCQDSFHIWRVWTLHCLHAPTELGNTIPKPQNYHEWTDELTVEEPRKDNSAQTSNQWAMNTTTDRGDGKKTCLQDCCATYRLEVKKKKQKTHTKQNHSEHDNSQHIKAITVIRIQGQFVLLDSLLPHARQAHFLLQLLHFFHFF